jgi:hypothetical protein
MQMQNSMRRTKLYLGILLLSLGCGGCVPLPLLIPPIAPPPPPGRLVETTSAEGDTRRSSEVAFHEIDGQRL